MIIGVCWSVCPSNTLDQAPDPFTPQVGTGIGIARRLAASTPRNMNGDDVEEDEAHGFPICATYCMPLSEERRDQGVRRCFNKAAVSWP